jgi:hypothetical protein
MESVERMMLKRVMANFLRTDAPEDSEVTVVHLPPGKSAYVEQISNNGRSIMLGEYRVDEKVIWVGYSSRSKTVYLSLPGS